MRTKDVEVQLVNHLCAYEIASRVLGNPTASRQQKDRASAILQRAEAGVVRISQEVISESAGRSGNGLNDRAAR